MRAGFLAALLPAALLAACQGAPVRPVPGGDIHRGAVALRQHACTTCHEIPGLVGADARLGPSLEGLAGRTYIAGHLPNTTENLVGWIIDPKAVDPLTAMPDLDVSPRDARDMAAYLYSTG